jgi:hypothetical protein
MFGRFLNKKFAHNRSKFGTDALDGAEKNRVDIINFLLQSQSRITSYLEIGIGKPGNSFHNIKSFEKIYINIYDVKAQNPSVFNLNSDLFFEFLCINEILSSDKRWDVIFIHGMDSASKVLLDVQNCLSFLADDGFIILQGCNPPSEKCAQEHAGYLFSPEGNPWSGNSWKAFVKLRLRNDIFSCCIDQGGGIGVISKKIPLRPYLLPSEVPFIEYRELNRNRKIVLNLLTIQEFEFLIYSFT